MPVGNETTKNNDDDNDDGDDDDDDDDMKSIFVCTSFCENLISRKQKRQLSKIAVKGNEFRYHLLKIWGLKRDNEVSGYCFIIPATTDFIIPALKIPLFPNCNQTKGNVQDYSKGISKET